MGPKSIEVIPVGLGEPSSVNVKTKQYLHKIWIDIRIAFLK